MSISARFQLLTCLMVYTSSAHAIMVKFGTKGGPIEPPAPEPVLPVPQPYRIPAPVWEERANDAPDPNAHWRPQLFIPQPRYTQVAYNPAVPTPIPLSSAQRFVNSYRPEYKPVSAEPIKNYFTPSQILSSQSLPGIGLSYFVPKYVNDLQIRKQELRQEDAKHNQIESNHVDNGNESSSDLQWKYEKDASKRAVRNTQEAAVLSVYQLPLFSLPRQQ